MIVDGTEISTDVETDVCIIGAGAAGITVALELRKKRFHVAVVESGGFENDDITQSLNRASQCGVITDKLHLNRLRYFGGTTGHWGGFCRPLDDADLMARSWVPYSGWPFLRSELDPFYARAHEICEIDGPNYDPNYWFHTAKKLGHDIFLDFNQLYAREPSDKSQRCSSTEKLFRSIVFHLSNPATRFGIRYRDDLSKSTNIIIYLHSNVVEIETNREARYVTSVKISTLKNTTFRIRAKYYVLAAGTVENTRLLLSSDSVHTGGLGNDNDMVGRFFGQHPVYRKTRFVGHRTKIMAFDHFFSKQNVVLGGSFTEQALRKNEMLSFSFFFIRQVPAERFGHFHWLRRMWEREDFKEYVGNFFSDIYGKSTKEKESLIYCTIEERPEQAPNPYSRLTLGSERDALGMRRIVMDWRLNDLDVQTMRRAQELIARGLGAAGIGRQKRWPDNYDPTRLGAEYLHGGHHHYGTTRMHRDPKQGVVDANCRVHGIANLYITGGSVFPTTGYANPTLTIIALAIRVAKEITSRV